MNLSNSHRRGRLATGIATQLRVAFDIDRKEALILEALVDLGGASVQQLAEVARVERTGAYDVLDRLVVRGLVVATFVGKRRRYRLVEPDSVRAIYASRLDRIDAVMPLLRERYEQSMGLPRVQSMAGQEASAQLLLLLDGSAGDSVSIAAPVVELPLGGVSPSSTSKFATLQLLVPSLLVVPAWRAVVDRSRSTEIRVASSRRPALGASLVRGDVVAYLADQDGLTMTMIRSKTLAQTQQSLFDAAWQHAKPISV